MKRFKANNSEKRDYARLLKDYFGFHIIGLELKEEGGQMQAQIIYTDFKHIDTVRKELTQMMPEVEFVKIKREFSNTAMLWALGNMFYEVKDVPVLYMKRGDTLVKTTIMDIAASVLRLIEFEDDSELPYSDADKVMHSDKFLKNNMYD